MHEASSIHILCLHKIVVKDIIEFIALICFASVFVMISLGYEKKKTGYGHKVLGIISGKDLKKEEGKKVFLNNLPLNAGGLIDKVDKKT